MKRKWMYFLSAALIAAFGATGIPVTTMAMETTAVNETVETVWPKIMDSIEPDRTDKKIASVSKNDIVSVEGKEVYGVVIPVHVTEPGRLCMDMAEVLNTGINGQTQIGLYKDQQCTDNTGYFYSYGNTINSFSGARNILVDAPGTYYLSISVKKTDPDFDICKVSFYLYLWSASGKTLEDGKAVTMAEADYRDYRYYQFKIEKAGHVLIKSTAEMDVSICGSDKEVLLKKYSLNSKNEYKTACYLQPGTYYIKTYGADVPAQLKYKYYEYTSHWKAVDGNVFTLYPNSDASNCQYIRYTADNTGTVTLRQTGQEEAYIALLDETMSALTKENMILGGTERFGQIEYRVKKGQTYYFQIRSGEKVPVRFLVTENATPFVLNFDLNGGTKTSETQKLLKPDSKYGTLPVPKRVGYNFEGWYTKKSGGRKVSASTRCVKDTTIYAHWKKVTVKKTMITNTTGGKQNFFVGYNKVSGAKGYQIRYSLHKSMKDARYIKVSLNKKKIIHVKSKRKYYVQVRAYKKDSAGKYVYGNWSEKSSVMTK